MTVARRRHKLHSGASGKRFACSVCRMIDPIIGLGEEIDWPNTTCKPSVEALEQFEAAARRQIQEAQADLDHAHTIRMEDYA